MTDELSNGVNKDYTSVHIQLSVYDDKIILWNPGKLPDELPLDRLKHRHPSYPRNKILADIFFKAGYIEAWGRGIRKIIDVLIAGHPEPHFEELAGGIELTLFKSSEKSGEKTVGETVVETVVETVGETPTGSSALILGQIKNNPRITREELAALTSLTVRGVEYQLSKLRQSGFIERVGSTKAGFWRLK